MTIYNKVFGKIQ